MAQKGKILLIEDDPNLSKMYEKKFSLDGFEIVTAFDGWDGLKKTVSEKPDLVLLDILLPGLDGIALFKKMRSQTETFNTPVILLTNVGEEDAIYECFKLGAVDYLVKADYTPAQVVKKVEDFLGERKINK